MSELTALLERYKNDKLSPSTDIKIKMIIARFNDLKHNMTVADFLFFESFDDVNKNELLSPVDEVNKISAEIARLVERFEHLDRYTEVLLILISNIGKKKVNLKNNLLYQIVILLLIISNKLLMLKIF